MYVGIAFVMLARALIEAGMMRGQQAFGLGGGFLSPDHIAMPFLTGVINYVMPLQIGACDVSFPVLNSISLGLTATGAALVMVSLGIGKFSTGGWFGYVNGGAKPGQGGGVKAGQCWELRRPLATRAFNRAVASERLSVD